MQGKHVLIVSPASARENNGNWQTASRWCRFLRQRHVAAIVQDWAPQAGAAPDLLIALHARRSAHAIAAFAAAFPERPRVLVLTGTDLYRDIADVPEARASLAHATRLVLLQSAGLSLLPPAMRAKASVIYQSAPTMRPPVRGPGRRSFDVCMIGHLRAEKDPYTFMRASSLVTSAKVRLLHIGGALESALGQAASATQAVNPHYQWLGNMAHNAARQRLSRSDLMVITSLMEGGANVIIEAVTSGVPVLASDINGNRGMLGADYAGYFEPGDAAQLARLIDRCIAEPAFYAELRRQCAARAPLFAPEMERASVLELVDNLFQS
ncbi:MAG: selenoneine biosynthesis selenosugar synthase SenB [Telluria sp.]|nr:selenoneine biosynthesis selenosugar synthase SenB [Telluria sp.]